MTIDQEIAAFLLADAGVSAIVPNDVWLCELPEGCTLGVAFQQISGPREVTLDRREKINARWQFTSYAPKPLDARALHQAVTAALTYFRGLLTPGGTFAESDALEDERGPLYDYGRDLYRFDADIVLSY